MQDLLPIIPSCFSPSVGDSTDTTTADDPSTAAKIGHSVVLSSYHTLIAGKTRLVTITWCKTLLALGLYISIESSPPSDDTTTGTSCCKVEMRPWNFWRRHGTRRFNIDSRHPVDVFWDLKTAKFSADDPEPVSDYYVAVVSDNEVVLLLGDQNHDAFQRSRSRPSMVDAVLVSKKEHVFGKKRFVTRAKLEEKGKCHELCVEFVNVEGLDCEMVMRVDGNVELRVKHLQWKFRGHGCVSVEKVKVEVYWDVHDWLFGSSSGLRRALFIFKPMASSSSSSSSNSLSTDLCLFLYAWKME